MENTKSNALVYIVPCLLLTLVLVITAFLGGFSIDTLKNWMYFLFGPNILFLGIRYAIKKMKDFDKFVRAHEREKNFPGYSKAIIRTCLYKFYALLFVTIAISPAIFVHALIFLLLLYFYLWTLIKDMWVYHKLPVSELIVSTLSVVAAAFVFANPVKDFLLQIWNALYISNIF